MSTTGTITVKAIKEEVKAAAPSEVVSGYTNLDIHFRKDQDQIDPVTGILKVSEEDYKNAKYPEWLPTWDPKQNFPQYADDLNAGFVDRGLYASPQLDRLFSENGSYKLKKLSPKLGSEVKGIQLSQLTNDQKDDLALFVAQRGVVVFRDQDLKDKGLQFNKEFGEYFGPLHVHPSSGAPLNYEQFHITYRRKDPNEYDIVHRHTLSTKGWHSDVTYERYTPGLTVFAMLDGPETGGDTVFSDCVEAYNRLSPKFKEMLQGLKGVHSSYEQAAQSRAEGSIERRPPTANEHPLVRIHPVTKQKSLFISRAFMKNISELKQEESEGILNLLTEHINNSPDLQIRASWAPGTVVLWDNRRVIHSATFDWADGHVRHCYRITPLAEKPVENEDELPELYRS